MTKQFDKEFKKEALQYRKDYPEHTVVAVCRNLGISQPTFYNWLKQTEDNDGTVAFRALVIMKVKKPKKSLV